MIHIEFWFILFLVFYIQFFILIELCTLIFNKCGQGCSAKGLWIALHPYANKSSIFYGMSLINVKVRGRKLVEYESHLYILILNDMWVKRISRMRDSFLFNHLWWLWTGSLIRGWTKMENGNPFHERRE